MQHGDEPRDEGLDIEYQYSVHVTAGETLANILRRQGIAVPETAPHVTFTSPTRIDLKPLKEKRIIKSYSISKVRRATELIEEG